MTPRKLRVLVEQLPADSAFARAVDPEWWWYRAEHEYLASLIEVIVAVNRDPKKPGTFKMPRPGDKERTRFSWNDFDALMGGAPNA